MIGDMVLSGHVWQVVETVAAVAAEYVPTPQLLQAALPLAILYVPAPHDEHAPPFRPVYPALHAQAATAELKLGESESPGHARQADAAVAAAAVE